MTCDFLTYLHTEPKVHVGIKHIQSENRINY